ncbi:MAG TPA: pyridoxal-phosphate dependent enzyme [Burkholderiales bacterium]|nr:pyridoxal-phosphate dependent enzyme [Burkholderiales bacterium]
MALDSASERLEEQAPSDLRALLGQIGKTPVSGIQLHIASRAIDVWLKLEGSNPAGSSKDRTALSLINDLERRGVLDEQSIVVESTSGNLGVALAFITRAKGYRFTAVVDPKAPAEVVARMVRLGAEIELVDTPDITGGFLLTRLARVRQLCESSKRYVWPDQYSNIENPEIHYRTTAPEIWQQMGEDVDAVFVAVSTGGTLAGVSRFFRHVAPSTRIIGVDAVGSVVFGGAPGPRKLNGIGSSRVSAFLAPTDYDAHLMVSDEDAFAMCRLLRDRCGLSVGGSSGAVIAACARYVSRNPGIRRPLCICADGGANYLSSIFSDAWIEAHGIALPKSPAGVEDVTQRTD